MSKVLDLIYDIIEEAYDDAVRDSVFVAEEELRMQEAIEEAGGTEAYIEKLLSEVAEYNINGNNNNDDDVRRYLDALDDKE